MMKKLSWLPVFLLIALIFYNSSLDAAASSNLSNPLAEAIQRFLHLPLSLEEVEHLIRKLAHFSEYALLGLLVFSAWKLDPPPWQKITPVIFLLVPVIDENIQRFSNGRSCEIKDMLIDTSGYIFGLLLGILILSIFKKRRELNP